MSSGARSRDEERQDLLKEYVLKCIQHSLLQWSDLLSLSAFNKLLKALSKDSKVVFLDLAPMAVVATAQVAAKAGVEWLSKRK